MIGTMIYLVVGVLLAIYWFKRDYSKEYKELAKNKEVEKGMAELLMVIMCLFWPIVMVKNLIKYKKV
jgi:H+/gluconate symporter-like permease